MYVCVLASKMLWIVRCEWGCRMDMYCVSEYTLTQQQQQQQKRIHTTARTPLQLVYIDDKIHTLTGASPVKCRTHTHSMRTWIFATHSHIHTHTHRLSRATRTCIHLRLCVCVCVFAESEYKRVSGVCLWNIAISIYTELLLLFVLPLLRSLCLQYIFQLNLSVAYPNILAHALFLFLSLSNDAHCFSFLVCHFSSYIFHRAFSWYILWLWSSDPICLCTNLLLLAAILADKQYHNFTKCFFSPLLADKKTPHSLIKVLNEMLIDMREKRTLIACWHANNGFVQGGESVLFPLVG